MSSDFNCTVASWFLGNVRVKPHSKHSAPPPPGSAIPAIWWCTTAWNRNKSSCVTHLVHRVSEIWLGHKLRHITLFCLLFDSEYIGLYKDVCTFLLGRLIRKWFNIHVNIISYLCSFDEFSVFLFLVKFDPCSKVFCEFLGKKKGAFLSLVLQNENLLCKKLLLNVDFLKVR